MSRASCSQICGICDENMIDGVHCYACELDLHYECAGITEVGYRKLGEERKQSWRCHKCRQFGINVPTPQQASPAVLDTSNASILREIRLLAGKLTTLESLPNEIKIVRQELEELRSTLGEVTNTLKVFSDRIQKTEDRLTKLENAKTDKYNAIQAQLEKMESYNDEREQFSRLNNVELKGLPQLKNENLLDVVSALGKKVHYPILKSQIDFVTRVQSRDPAHTKPVIISFINRYVKEDFIAASRAYAKTSPIMATELGGAGKPSMVYVNDHLTLKNKSLLARAKKLAKEQEFKYVWVKFCKIFVRRDDTSPVLNIKSEKDLAKIVKNPQHSK